MEGEVTFIAKDACEALGVDWNNARRALDADERGLVKLTTPGGTQECATITEPGLYKLMARSSKPEAKAFDRWVRKENAEKAVTKSFLVAVASDRGRTQQGDRGVAFRQWVTSVLHGEAPAPANPRPGTRGAVGLPKRGGLPQVSQAYIP